MITKTDEKNIILIPESNSDYFVLGRITRNIRKDSYYYEWIGDLIKEFYILKNDFITFLSIGND